MGKNHGCISKIDLVVLDQQSEREFTVAMRSFSETTAPTSLRFLPDHGARDI